MPTILVIDDEPNIADNLADLIQIMGHEVQTATDGREGIAQCRALAPDLVICDVMMPDVDGHEVLETIRDTNDLAGTPFIFLTANANLNDQQQGSMQRADAHLTKPFDVNELLALIDQFLADA